MGISKAMMEKVFVAKSRNVEPSRTLICGTRYGNVMASRGSVIPLFVEKIKLGEDLPVTNPHMTRYLMTLDEAVDLVIYAFNNAKQGDIFVQKAPASSIGNLAKAVQELFESQNKITIIGTRHGEKLYETLMTKEEMKVSEDLGDFYRIPADNRDLNYEKYFTQGQEDIDNYEDYNSSNAYQLSIEQIKNKLMQLEYIKDELILMRKGK